MIFEVVDRPAQEFMNALKERGVLTSYTGGRRVRMVTHYGIAVEDIDEALGVVESVTGERGRAGR